MQRRTFLTLALALAGCSKPQPTPTPSDKLTGQTRLDVAHFFEDVDPILGRVEKFLSGDVLHRATVHELETVQPEFEGLSTGALRVRVSYRNTAIESWTGPFCDGLAGLCGSLATLCRAEINCRSLQPQQRAKIEELYRALDPQAKQLRKSLDGMKARV